MHTQHTPTIQLALETLRERLLQQIEQQRGGTKGRAEVAAEHFAHSEDSDAQVATERDLEFAINERETDELAALDAALARWSAGTYGRCIDCDADIPTARLQATPEAARCITCQEKIESHPH
jgi:DnaK suppressor protein